MVKLRKLTWLIGIGFMLSTQSTLADQTCKASITKTTPSADFTDNNDGTITHKTTGLMWKKCTEGLLGTDCTTGTANTYTWGQALQHANTVEFAGYSDWRLPNIKELASIVELNCRRPAINLTIFPNTSVNDYWSSSPDTNGDGNAWGVEFLYGDGHHNSKDDSYRARLVRARDSGIAETLNWKTSPLNGHKYANLNCDSWTQCQDKAVLLGGNLATVRSAEENQWLYDSFYAEDGVRNLFIGLKQLPNEGNWVWISGERLTYFNWDAGEPNNYGGVGENYGHVFFTKGKSLWNDTINKPGGRFGGIIEK